MAGSIPGPTLKSVTNFTNSPVCCVAGEVRAVHGGVRGAEAGHHGRVERAEVLAQHRRRQRLREPGVRDDVAVGDEHSLPGRAAEQLPVLNRKKVHQQIEHDTFLFEFFVLLKYFTRQTRANDYREVKQ